MVEVREVKAGEVMVEVKEVKVVSKLGGVMVKDCLLWMMTFKLSLKVVAGQCVGLGRRVRVCWTTDVVNIPLMMEIVISMMKR